MSPLGYERRFRSIRNNSALPLTTDMRTDIDFGRNVPMADVVSAIRSFGRRGGTKIMALQFLAAIPRLLRSLHEIARHDNYGVIADVAVPVHGLDAFRGSVARVECFRRTILVGHRIGALQEVDGGRPVLVVVNADVTAWLDVEHAQPQLPPGHGRNFGTEIDRYRLRGGVAHIALRRFFCADGGLPREHRRES